MATAFLAGGAAGMKHTGSGIGGNCRYIVMFEGIHRQGHNLPPVGPRLGSCLFPISIQYGVGTTLDIGQFQGEMIKIFGRKVSAGGRLLDDFRNLIGEILQFVHVHGATMEEGVGLLQGGNHGNDW